MDGRTDSRRRTGVSYRSASYGRWCGNTKLQGVFGTEVVSLKTTGSYRRSEETTKYTPHHATQIKGLQSILTVMMFATFSLRGDNFSVASYQPSLRMTTR
jgi:hypothetical protein